MLVGIEDRVGLGRRVGRRRLAEPSFAPGSGRRPTFERREKLPRYREAGIAEIWLVDPFRERVRVERRRDGGYDSREVGEGEVESTTVPGFRIDAAWLWREELPSSFSCLCSLPGG